MSLPWGCDPVVNVTFGLGGGMVRHLELASIENGVINCNGPWTTLVPNPAHNAVIAFESITDNYWKGRFCIASFEAGADVPCRAG